MARNLRTKQGYDFYEIASLLQKAIRRNKPALAGFAAHELYASGYAGYAWKRLLTVSAEDCAGILTKEIIALHEAWKIANLSTPKSQSPKGRVFMSKAVLLLCQAEKCRDADHLGILVYDRKMISDEDVAELDRCIPVGRVDIPDYVYDVHTRRGKAMGRTKDHFLKEEQAALTPKNNPSQLLLPL